MDQKLHILDGIYRIYDDWITTMNTACRPGCAVCCTQNLTLTTLEGVFILQSLDRQNQFSILKSLETNDEKNTFRPQTTINEIARICMAGRDAPEEDVPGNPDRCRLLVDETCPVYPVRPFGCRCMVSRRICRVGSAAEMPEWVVTVNQVFQQTIEHIDVPGCTGNLADTLAALMDESFSASYRNGNVDCRSRGLAPNQPAPALMIPPEFRQRIQPILKNLAGLEKG